MGKIYDIRTGFPFNFAGVKSGNDCHHSNGLLADELVAATNHLRLAHIPVLFDDKFDVDFFTGTELHHALASPRIHAQ